MKDQLATPQKQAFLAILVMFSKNIIRTFKIFFWLIIPLVVNRGEGGFRQMLVYIVLFGVVAFISVLSYFQYHRFFFFVKDGNFLIQEGVFKRDKTTIPFDRIQTVHLKQNIIQQILGVVGVTIETAGSKAKEVEIPALSRTNAESLKHYLLEKRANVVETTTDAETHDTENQELDSPSFNAVQEKSLLNLNLFDLFKIGLTENHIKTALIALGFTFGYLNQFAEFFGYDIGDATQLLITETKEYWVFLPLFVILFSFFSILLSLILIVLRYFNFKALLSSKRLVVEGGLFNRREFIVPAQKIQFIKWWSNPLRRILKLKSLHIYQAGSMEKSKKRAVVVPGCRNEEIEKVNDAFFPELEESQFYSHYKPNKYYLRRLVIFFGVIPFLGLSGAAIWNETPIHWGPIAYFFLALFLIKKYFESVEYRLSDEIMIWKKGWVFPEEILFKIHKIQNVSMRQSIWQKRRGLASLKISTAGGTLNLLFLPEQTAFQLMDRMLYKIESSKKPWM